MANRFNPFFRSPSTVQPGPVSRAAISQLPEQWQHLLTAVWNDPRSLGLVIELWDKALKNTPDDWPWKAVQQRALMEALQYFNRFA